PELPEVEALADHLRRHAVGLTVGRVDVSAFSVLKTFDPPVTALYGQTVTGAAGRRITPDHSLVPCWVAQVVGQPRSCPAQTRQGANRAAGAPGQARR